MSDEFRPGLEEALHQARTGRATRRDRKLCSLCIVIEYATPGVVQDTLRADAAGRLSARALYRALRSAGVRIDRVSINNHRSEAHQ